MPVGRGRVVHRLDGWQGVSNMGRMSGVRHNRQREPGGVRQFRTDGFWSSWVLGGLLVLGLLGARTALGQELSPRAYWPAPVGTQLFFAGYGYQTGDIVTNAALPIVDVDSRIHRLGLGYQKTLSLWGRTSNLRVEAPWVDGTTKGAVEGEPGRRDVSGLGDLSMTLSVNLLGAPAMSPGEYQAFRADPGPVVAASRKVLAPTGDYDEERLVNIGTNRWAARARVGYIQPLPNRWMFELSVGTWFFQDNDEFLGETLQQDPLTAVDASLVHRFAPGFWASLDGTYYFGGRTEVENVGRADFQRNSRVGISLAYPFGPGHALKGSYSVGVSTNAGGEFDIFSLNYVYLLGARKGG